MRDKDLEDVVQKAKKSEETIMEEWWQTTPIPELIECPHMRRHACPPGCDKC